MQPTENFHSTNFVTLLYLAQILHAAMLSADTYKTTTTISAKHFILIILLCTHIHSTSR